MKIVWKLGLNNVALCKWAKTLKLRGREGFRTNVCNLRGTCDKVEADFLVPDRLMHVVVSHMYVTQL